jgi:hypothetical protein
MFQRIGEALTMEDVRRWIPYCGEAPGPEVWLSRWNLDPVLGVWPCCCWPWRCGACRWHAADPRARLG